MKLFVSVASLVLIFAGPTSAQWENWWKTFFSQGSNFVFSANDEQYGDLIRCKYSIECPASINPELMCVGASWYSTMGYCLPPVDPSEYGCRMDDQCRLTDYNTVCSQQERNELNERRCVCKPGFLLFDGKCVEPSPSSQKPQLEVQKSSETTKDELATLKRCYGSQDCFSINITLSCVGASVGKAGYCLQPLKPMEYGCLMDNQCTKACPTSHCSKEERFKNGLGQRQCRCDDDRYYMFHKCWKNCLDDISEAVVLNDGTKICRQKTNLDTPNPEQYLRRFKRQIQSSKVIC